MHEAPQAELFLSLDNPHAAYAVGLITRMAKAIDEEMGRRARDELPYRDDEDVRNLLGPDLWSEMCHAIGWDIDWEAVHYGHQR